MFVRWKTWERKGSRCVSPGKTYSALMVESIRVDGRPRHRIVAQLGKIRQDLLEHDTHCLFRARFWQKVVEKLDEIEEPFDREKAEATIEKVVPRPSPEEIEASTIEVERRCAVKREVWPSW